MSGVSGSDIDPSWWAAAFTTITEPGGYETPELLASSFQELLKAGDLPELQRRVLEALAVATDAMLDPDNWLDPYKPAIQLGDRRSALPSDLDPEQLALLARLAPLISQATLQARVADVAWYYGNRGALELADLAINAYRSVPLEPRAWHHVGRDSWRRAFELARRRGKAGREPITEMGHALQERIFASTIDDGFMITQLSELLRLSAPVDTQTARKLAEHCVALADMASQADLRLARHLDREAHIWFLKCSDQTAAKDCIARVADRYVAEADQRAAQNSSGAMVAGILLEKAIAAIRTLPRTYRKSAGLEERLVELRARLAESREATLESMTSIESDSVDLAQYAEQARQRVSGKSQFEALVHFSDLQPLTNAEEAFTTAREQIKGSLVHLFGRATFSHDGRKVAATGGTGRDEEAQRLWSQVLFTFGIRVSMLGAGFLLPAQEILTFEHRYDLNYVRSVCAESPTVPARHVELWARGLWHGLNGDYLSAASVLVPQLEHLVRHHLKMRGIHTLMVDDETGVESEKSLNALLDMGESNALLGPDMIFELRALLIEQEGANLRNHVAHGLFNDSEAFSYSTVYAWWLCLRLVVLPLWNMKLQQVSQAVEGDAGAGDPDGSA